MYNPVKPLPHKIVNVKKETDLEYTFRVETKTKVKFGQFLQLSIPKIGEAPISVSDQGIGWLEFTIRNVGKVTNEIFEKKEGDTIFLRGPYGNSWPIEKFKDKNLVIIAGGTGVSPVRGMINYLSKNKDYVKSLHLICGFKNKECVLFKEDLKVWANTFNTTFTLDNEESKGFKKGFVTAFIKDIPFNTFGEDYEVVVVGPPMMMKFSGLELEKCGVDINKIWMSFERKMSCAIGKCGHCRIDEYYVCLDGPIFEYRIAKDLID